MASPALSFYDACRMFNTAPANEMLPSDVEDTIIRGLYQWHLHPQPPHAARHPFYWLGGNGASTVRGAHLFAVLPTELLHAVIQGLQETAASPRLPDAVEELHRSECVERAMQLARRERATREQESAAAAAASGNGKGKRSAAAAAADSDDDSGQRDKRANLQRARAIANRLSCLDADSQSVILSMLSEKEAMRYAAHTSKGIWGPDLANRFAAKDHVFDVADLPYLAPGLVVRSVRVSELDELKHVPATARVLHMALKFDEPGFVLPPQIKVFHMGVFYNQPDFLLPAGVEEFYMGAHFSQHDLVLPDGLKVFQMGVAFFPLDLVLPPSVKEFRMSVYFNQPGFVLPPSVEVFHMGFGFDQPGFVLPPSVKVFHMGHRFDQPGFVLPPSVEVFHMGQLFNQPGFVLPPRVKVFYMGDSFNGAHLEFPASLKVLHTGKSFNQLNFNFITPPGVERV